MKEKMPRPLVLLLGVGVLLLVWLVTSRTRVRTVDQVGTPKHGGGTSRLSRVSGGSYNEFRVSEVWKGPPENAETDFAFRLRWTDHSFRTKLVSNVPSGFPGPLDAVRGILLADVCFSSKYINCLYGNKYETLNKLTWMLNQLAEHEELNFWTLIGDNFYDGDGSLSDMFFKRLGAKLTSQVPLYAVAGNHDLWIRGVPSSEEYNQFGYGFAQYYMMDVDASHRNDNDPFPFTFPPSAAPSMDILKVPSQDNFFHYSTVGPLGFILFNGAIEFEADRFERACKYFSPDEPGGHVQFVLLMGHWSSSNMGCQERMHTAGVFEEMGRVDGSLSRYCYPLVRKNRVYFVDGHDHVNKVLGPHGMRVAGMGMAGTGAFGFPLVQVYQSRGKANQWHFLLRYISLAKFPWDPHVHKRFETLKACAAHHGVFGCLDRLSFVHTWFNSTVTHQPPALPRSRISVY